MLILILNDVRYYFKNHGLIVSFFNLGFWSIILYRFGSFMVNKSAYKYFLVWYIYILIKSILQVISKIELPPTARIGSNINLVHAYGLVMGDKVIVKNNVTIGPWVVIGHNGDKAEQPVIMEHSYLGAKCSVLGGITIGKNSIVSPNTVISVDLADNFVAKTAFCQITRVSKL